MNSASKGIPDERSPMLTQFEFALRFAMDCSNNKDSIVTHIISLMKQQIFLPYQYIVVAGQSGYGAIFIITGEVQLFKIHGNEEVPLSVYGQGSFISESLNTLAKPKGTSSREIVARSITYCTTFRLSVEGLNIIRETYPSLAKRLEVVFQYAAPAEDDSELEN